MRPRGTLTAYACLPHLPRVRRWRGDPGLWTCNAFSVGEGHPRWAFGLPSADAPYHCKRYTRCLCCATKHGHTLGHPAGRLWFPGVLRFRVSFGILPSPTPSFGTGWGTLGWLALVFGCPSTSFRPPPRPSERDGAPWAGWLWFRVSFDILMSPTPSFGTGWGTLGWLALVFGCPSTSFRPPPRPSERDGAPWAGWLWFRVSFDILMSPTPSFGTGWGTLGWPALVFGCLSTAFHIRGYGRTLRA